MIPFKVNKQAHKENEQRKEPRKRPIIINLIKRSLKVPNGKKAHAYTYAYTVERCPITKEHIDRHAIIIKRTYFDTELITRYRRAYQSPHKRFIDIT